MKYTKTNFQALLESIESATDTPHYSWVVGKTRKRPEVIYRQIFMYMARHVMFKSYTEIGRFLNMNHTTVIHGSNQVKSWLSMPKYYPVENNLFNKISIEYGTRNEKNIYVDSKGYVWRRDTEQVYTSLEDISI